MNVAILITLILNVLFFGLVVLGLAYDLNEKKHKNIKRIGELEYQLGELRKEYAVYKQMNAITTKFAIGQNVLVRMSVHEQCFHLGTIQEIIVQKNEIYYTVKLRTSPKDTSNIVSITENLVNPVNNT